MLPLVLAFHKLARAMAAVWRDPETKALPVVAGALVISGTIFYILTGIGVFVALLASVAQQYIAQKSETPSARERLNTRRQRRQGE